MKAEFFDRFFKNIRMSDLMKIRPAGAEFFPTERWIDMTKMLNAPEDELESMRKEEVVV
jgi:hypothetical protein